MIMRHQYIKQAALCLLLTTASSVQAAPQAYQASYSVVKSGLILGEMQANLAYSATSYTFQKVTKANGLAALISGDVLTERSVGSKQGEQLRPLNYLYHHKNRRKDKLDQLAFSTPTQVKGRYKDENYNLTVPAGTVDLNLMELRIMEDVKANRPLTYHVAEKGKLKTYQFRRLGQESISAAGKTYLCEKVQMQRDNGERETTLWLAPELGYAPAQIRHNEEGDIIEAHLTRYQAR